MGWRAADVRGARHLVGQFDSRRAKPRHVVEVEQEKAVGVAAAVVAGGSKITFLGVPSGGGVCPPQQPTERLDFRVQVVFFSE